MQNYILSLGDCNTLGFKHLYKNSYPERFAELVNKKVINCGYTMSTIEEGKYFFNENISNNIDIITIQYGLVDSWETFKYSPQVLYYPNNMYRKILRKLVKKYKKICRNFGFHKIFGTKNLVDIDIFKKNIENMIKSNNEKIFFLIDTVPKTTLFNSENIIRYNSVLDQLTSNYNNCIKIDLYETFLENKESFYLDETHINENGYDFIVDKLYKSYLIYKNDIKL